MRLLLDTHALLWAAADDARLSAAARQLIANPDNELLFSAAGGYEIGIKAAKGMLTLPDAPGVYLATRLLLFGIETLPVTLAHASLAAALPLIHADPWDRILIAQAQAESVPILTANRTIAQYEVQTLW